jgi:hypothetical protein
MSKILKTSTWQVPVAYAVFFADLACFCLTDLHSAAEIDEPASHSSRQIAAIH